MKIDFSSFADLRPKECVLVGSRDTHSVCVCTIHQNVKLMNIGSRMEDIGGNVELKHYSHELSLIRCSPFHPNCTRKVHQLPMQDMTSFESVSCSILMIRQLMTFSTNSGLQQIDRS